MLLEGGAYSNVDTKDVALIRVRRLFEARRLLEEISYFNKFSEKLLIYIVWREFRTSK